MQGCNTYYKLIRKKKVLNSIIKDREAVWHQELNTTYGLQFWNKSYALTTEIKNDNRLKWLQFQIVGNSLFTNHKVSKFNPNIFPYCRNCFSTEKIGHLVWDCGQAQIFWQEIKVFLEAFQITSQITAKIAIFGYHKE